MTLAPDFDAAPELELGAAETLPLPERTRLSIREEVWKTLSDDPDFLRRRFAGEGEPPMLRILDSDHRTTLMLRAARIAELEIRNGGGDSSRPEVISSAVAVGVEYARERRDSLKEIWERCLDKKVIAVFGSARDAVKTEESEGFLRTFAKMAVERGYCLINGGAETGWMGLASRIFREEIQSFRARGGSTDSEVILVPLHFHQDTREKPSTLGSEGFVMDASESFLSRTPLLYVLGDRACDLVFPGGIGSLEEGSMNLADGKLLGKGSPMMQTLFSHQQALPNITFISESFQGSEGCWEPLARMLRKMEVTRAAKASDFAHAHFFDLSEADELARLLIEHVETFASTREGERRMAELREETPIERIAGAVREELDCDPEFSKQLPPSAPAFEHLLDAQYRELTVIRAEDHARRELVNSYPTDSAPENGVFARIVSEAVALARNWRDSLVSFMEECRDKPVITFIGGAKDHLWTPELEAITTELIRKAVTAGYSLVVGGDASEGLSKRVQDTYFAEMGRYREGHGGANSVSNLYRLQLNIEGEASGPRSEHGVTERLGPPLETLRMRSSLLTYLGKSASVLCYPGGPTELETMSGLALASQLQHSVTGPYHGRKAPHVFLMNADLDGTGRFYDPLKEQFDTMCDPRIGSADRNDLANFTFLNLTRRDADVKSKILWSMISRNAGGPLNRNGRRQLGENTA